MFQERGISVYHTIQQLKGFSGDTNYEFDIIAQNRDKMVVVEVKTTLRSSDVKEFAYKMEKFREWLPRYAENTFSGQWDISKQTVLESGRQKRTGS